MKRLITLLLCVLLFLCGCGQVERTVEVDMITSDIITPAIAYSTASAMLQKPKDYQGKSVQAEGCILAQTDRETGITYHFIEIADVQGCCSEYLEVELTNGLEYPEEDKIMYVYGTWEAYDENGKTFYHILVDRMELSQFETEVQ